LRLSRPAQRLIEIGDDVGLVFEADGQADNVVASACRRALGFGQLPVRGGGRVDDQRAGVADVGEMREQLDARARLTSRQVVRAMLN
jgi:hypothetical protein